MDPSLTASPTRKMLAFETADEPEESWILSYLDVFVLIATLFIVLTIIAQLKLEQQQAQQAEQQQALARSQTTLVAVQQQLTELTARSGNAAFETAPASLPALLAEQQWNDELAITSHDDYTELQIRDRVLFASADALLLPEGNDLLARLVPLLQRSPGMIYIEGHTDNQPIDTVQFHSNWELAAARATNVLQYFASKGIASKRLRAVSVADTAPIASNRDESGRAQNRRVTILVRQNEVPATTLAVH